jgi:chromosomal replication initiator protein
MSQYEDFAERGPCGRDAVVLFETVRREVRADVGESGYLSYVQHLQCCGLWNGALVVVADNVVQRDWVQRHCHERFEKRLAAHGAPERVRILSRDETPGEWLRRTGAADQAGVGAAAASAPAQSWSSAGGLAGLPPKPDMTFDSFAVGASNHRAYTVARMAASGLGMAFPVVLIHGAPGLGKTHLLHAIANDTLLHDQRRKVRQMMAQEFIEEFQAMLHTKKDSAGFKAGMREPDLLLVDDVQRIMGKTRTEEEFFDTLLFMRQKGGAQVVMTADHGPDGLLGFDQRMRQQLKAATTCEITAPDFALRRSILSHRMAHYQRLAPDFRLSADVLDMIAERVTESGRLLDGALAQLLVETSILGEDITVQLAEEALRGKLGDAEVGHRITVQHVQKVVAAYFGLTVQEMLARGRQLSTRRPRQIAKYLATVHTTCSLPDLGKRFALPGDKPWDHTTVIHSRDLIPDLMKKDAKLRADIEALTAQIKKKP